MKKIKLANTRSVTLSLRNYTEFPEPLSKDEAKRLLLEYQSGNLKSGEKLLVHNLRFLTVIISQYKEHIKSQSFNVNDLMSEAVMGFYYAISRFSLSKGDMTGFITYFTKCVQGYVLSFLQKNNNDIKLPTSFYSQYKTILQQMNVENDIEKQDIKNEILDDLCNRQYHRQNLHLINVVSNEVNIFYKQTIEGYFKQIYNSENSSVEYIKEIDFHICSPDVTKKLHNEDLKKIIALVLKKMDFKEVCILKSSFGLYNTAYELYEDILKLEIKGSKDDDFKKQLLSYYVPFEDNNFDTLSLFFQVKKESIRATKAKVIRHLRHVIYSNPLREFYPFENYL